MDAGVSGLLEGGRRSPLGFSLAAGPREGEDEAEMRGGMVAPRSAFPSPYRPCSGSPGPARSLRLFRGGQGLAPARAGANPLIGRKRYPSPGRPGAPWFPASWLLRRLGAKKNKLQGASLWGRPRSCYDNCDLRSRGVFPTALPLSSRLWGRRVGRVEILRPCRPGSLALPSDPHPQVWASASSWGAPPSALTDPRN